MDLELIPAGGRPVSTGGPAAADLACYDDWALRFRSVAWIAHEHHRPIPAVLESLQRIDAWLRREFFSDLERMRVRQTMLLESAVECTVDQWKEEFDLKTFTETRQILQDMRRLWGLEKSAPAEATGDADGSLPRVAGHERPAALRTAGHQLLTMADEIESRGGSVAGAESAARPD